MAKKKFKIKPKLPQAGFEGPKLPRPVGKRAVSKDFPFSRSNYLLFGIGLGVIILGFLMLALGDITLSPILLVAGYCIIIPAAILYGKKEKKAEEPASKPGLDTQAQTSGD